MLRRARPSLAFAILLAAVASLPALASHGGNHTFPVQLSIKVDGKKDTITVEAHSEAPAQFCEQSTIRIRQAMKGKDKVLFRNFPNDFGAIKWKVPNKHQGKRVYGEVGKYNLPDRPITCLGDETRRVNAP